ncbi:MAG: adenylate kinase [Bacilli bacterium]|nr:adenylate kinase [Bacilli bacterium]
MKNIIFLGAPGSGKGTHSNMLITDFGYTQISTGDLLREIIAQESELGQKIKNIIASGEFVSDDIILELIKKKLENVEGKPFILDGFPRNLTQAQVLDKMLAEKKIDYQVIYLDVDEETCKKRIVGRLTCKCGRSYNLFTEDLKPKVENICDECGSTLTKREDDNEEAFTKRFKLYMENTTPLLGYYESEGKLITIDANQNENKDRLDIHKEIVGVIND